MTADEAKSEILEQIKSEAKFLAASQAQKIIDEAKENASEQAKKIVIQTIQRVATEHSIENSTSTTFQIYRTYLLSDRLRWYDCIQSSVLQ